MIHPSISAEMPEIELESDQTTLLQVTVCSRPSVTEQVSAVRISAGPGAPPKDDVATRGVDDAPNADDSDNADQGGVPDKDDTGDNDVPRVIAILISMTIAITIARTRTLVFSVRTLMKIVLVIRNRRHLVPCKEHCPVGPKDCQID